MLPHWPMNFHHNFFEILASGKSKFYLPRGSSSGVPGNVQAVDIACFSQL
jgi:hypothetical protein